jgi:hypothetical protein
MMREGDDDNGTVQDLGHLSCFLALIEGLQKAPELYGKVTNQREVVEESWLKYRDYMHIIMLVDSG